MANRGRHRKSGIPTNLRNFPKHILNRLMECQIEQGNKADLTVFAHDRRAHKFAGGFNWNNTIEGYQIWHDRLINNSTI